MGKIVDNFSNSVIESYMSVLDFKDYDRFVDEETGRVSYMFYFDKKDHIFEMFDIHKPYYLESISIEEGDTKVAFNFVGLTNGEVMEIIYDYDLDTLYPEDNFLIHNITEDSKPFVVWFCQYLERFNIDTRYNPDYFIVYDNAAMNEIKERLETVLVDDFNIEIVADKFITLTPNFRKRQDMVILDKAGDEELFECFLERVNIRNIGTDDYKITYIFRNANDRSSYQLTTYPDRIEDSRNYTYKRLDPMKFGYPFVELTETINKCVYPWKSESLTESVNNYSIAKPGYYGKKDSEGLYERVCEWIEDNIKVSSIDVKDSGINFHTDLSFDLKNTLGQIRKHKLTTIHVEKSLDYIVIEFMQFGSRDNIQCFYHIKKDSWKVYGGNDIHNMFTDEWLCQFISELLHIVNPNTKYNESNLLYITMKSYKEKICDFFKSSVKETIKDHDELHILIDNGQKYRFPENTYMSLSSVILYKDPMGNKAVGSIELKFVKANSSLHTSIVYIFDKNQWFYEDPLYSIYTYRTIPDKKLCRLLSEFAYLVAPDSEGVNFNYWYMTPEEESEMLEESIDYSVSGIKHKATEDSKMIFDEKVEEITNYLEDIDDLEQAYNISLSGGISFEEHFLLKNELDFETDSYLYGLDLIVYKPNALNYQENPYNIELSFKRHNPDNPDYVSSKLFYSTVSDTVNNLSDKPVYHLINNRKTANYVIGLIYLINPDSQITVEDLLCEE